MQRNKPLQGPRESRSKHRVQTQLPELQIRGCGVTGSEAQDTQARASRTATLNGACAGICASAGARDTASARVRIRRSARVARQSIRGDTRASTYARMRPSARDARPCIRGDARAGEFPAGRRGPTQKKVPNVRLNRPNTKFALDMVRTKNRPLGRVPLYRGRYLRAVKLAVSRPQLLGKIIYNCPYSLETVWPQEEHRGAIFLGCLKVQCQAEHHRGSIVVNAE